MVDTSQQLIRIHRAVFGQREIFSFVLYSRSRIDGKVTMVHFVDNHVSRRFQRRTLIALPPFGVRRFPVNDSSTFPVHSDGMGIDTWCVSLPFIVDFHVEGIEFIEQILVHYGRPGSVFAGFHLYCLVGMTAIAFIIKHQAHFFGCRRPERERSCFRRILHFCKTSRTNRI